MGTQGSLSRSYFHGPHLPSFTHIHLAAANSSRTHCKPITQTGSARVCVHTHACVYVCINIANGHPPFCTDTNPVASQNPVLPLGCLFFHQRPKSVVSSFRPNYSNNDDICPWATRKGAVASPTFSEHVLNKRTNLHGGHPKHICITSAFWVKNSMLNHKSPLSLT